MVFFSSLIDHPGKKRRDGRCNNRTTIKVGMLQKRE